MLSDVAAIMISLAAIHIATRPDAHKLPLLFRRAEVFAALINGLGLCGIVIEIVREGIEALSQKREPIGGLMMGVSLFAIATNSFCIWILHRGHSHHHGRGHDHTKGHQLNIHSARLHLLGDMFGSIAAFIAAVVIRLGGPTNVDVIAAFVVAAILALGAFNLLRDSIRILIA
jgi:cobalt-zinc-cadmium efflux system protein